MPRKWTAGLPATVSSFVELTWNRLTASSAATAWAKSSRLPLTGLCRACRTSSDQRMAPVFSSRLTQQTSRREELSRRRSVPDGGRSEKPWKTSSYRAPRGSPAAAAVLPGYAEAAMAATTASAMRAQPMLLVFIATL